MATLWARVGCPTFLTHGVVTIETVAKLEHFVTIRRELTKEN